MASSFNALGTLDVQKTPVRLYRLDALQAAGVNLARLPFSLKILLENLLRHEDGVSVTRDDILALANWDPAAVPSR